MISEAVLRILVCPQSKQQLKTLNKKATEEVENLFDKGLLKTVGDSKVVDKPLAMLVREDRKVAYQVKDGIPVLLVEEGIDLSELES